MASSVVVPFPQFNLCAQGPSGDVLAARLRACGGNLLGAEQVEGSLADAADVNQTMLTLAAEDVCGGFWGCEGLTPKMGSLLNLAMLHARGASGLSRRTQALAGRAVTPLGPISLARWNDRIDDPLGQGRMAN